VVLLDEIVDAVSTELGLGSALAELTIRSAKFLRPVRPGDELQIRLALGEGKTVRFVCSVGADAAVSGVLVAGQSGKT
jgi:acyl dehydratase